MQAEGIYRNGQNCSLLSNNVNIKIKEKKNGQLNPLPRDINLPECVSIELPAHVKNSHARSGRCGAKHDGETRQNAHLCVKAHIHPVISEGASS